MSHRDPEKVLERCAVVIERPVTWGAMDAFQHVNNTVYFRYFEDVRIAYFDGVLGERNEHGVGPILAETRCRFKAPLGYPDTVRIGTWISEVGEDRFTMEYVVVSERLARVAAIGSGLIVCYDYRAGHKAELPESWRARLQVSAGRPLDA